MYSAPKNEKKNIVIVSIKSGIDNYLSTDFVWTMEHIGVFLSVLDSEIVVHHV